MTINTSNTSQDTIIMNYVPLMIYPPAYMPKSRWELLPGIWLEKIPKEIKQKIIEIDQKIFFRLNFQPNFVVSIENSKYTNGLESRIADEGKIVPKIPAEVDPILTNAKDLVKLLIISLILQKKFSFVFGHTYNFTKSYSKSNKILYRYHDINIHFNEKTPSKDKVFGFFPQKKAKQIDRKILINTIKLLERYFRPYPWQIDRLSVALENFWNALTVDSIAQSFLNLTIMFESLLSTSKYEILHTVSERAAILLGKNTDQRIEIYRDFKKIYDQRSKIVHGEGVPKKGKLDWNSFVISTKLSIIPQECAKKLFKYSFQLLTNIFNKPEIIKIIQSNKKAKQINEELSNYFLKILMDKK